MIFTLDAVPPVVHDKAVFNFSPNRLGIKAKGYEMTLQSSRFWLYSTIPFSGCLRLYNNLLGESRIANRNPLAPVCRRAPAFLSLMFLSIHTGKASLLIALFPAFHKFLFSCRYGIIKSKKEAENVR